MRAGALHRSRGPLTEFCYTWTVGEHKLQRKKEGGRVTITLSASFFGRSPKDGVLLWLEFWKGYLNQAKW